MDGADEGVAVMQYLDVAHPSVRQLVSRSWGKPDAMRFVRVDIAEVVNPAKVAVSFEVSYQPPGGAPVPLGSFSLYPPDNPGQFIVPTQAKVKAGGTIVVSMVVVDSAYPGTTLRVGIRSIAAVSGERERPRG